MPRSPSPRRDERRSRSPARRHDDRDRDRDRDAGRKKQASGFRWKEKRRDDDRDRGRDSGRSKGLERGYRDSDRRRSPFRDRDRERDRDRDHDRGRGRDRECERRPEKDDVSGEKEKREKKKKPAAAPSNEPMIIVNVNDRLGTKAAIPCLASDPIRLFKAQVAARIGREPHEILLKRQGERPFKDQLTLEDYGVSNGVQLDLEVDTGD
ncbi:hypothetical protein McanMca71_000252 [Microsporum canis]|uniref:Ubiquitin-like modifier HUB1 n=1 Tax=Arthroderma otae (strain ATCC MYA-4605 / CBS 113480) TaxID=554155 RepID=C5FD70_ARTOC|nr:conserved hypothetical protein [Microsporum canis CBS 113480]EEQ27754.1 conserved hypothetical protein [Microsporum canis CBS 113480]